MRIRSITSFYDPSSPNANDEVKNLARVSAFLRDELGGQVMAVQSTRLATSPFPLFMKNTSILNLENQARQMEASAREMGWQYLSLGPALPDAPWSYGVIPDLIAATEDVFFSTIIADRSLLYPASVRSTARIIHEIAGIEENGFANLKFAALAHVKPWAPFLPAAYHRSGTAPAFSIAVECADAVVTAFKDSDDLHDSRMALLNTLEEVTRRISTLITPIISGTAIQFKGFDLSPAPYPEDWCSLGGAVELLGLEHIGSGGSLSAVAYIADTLDRGIWQRAGFNGMMLPLLEDSVLARRAEQGLLTINDLLLYSAVCGTGLDTIPISGDTSISQLESVLMDIGSLAVRLGKPLTARLMPIPGRQAGERTSFDFAFFANSRILALDGQKLSSPLNGDTPLRFSPRQPGS